MASYYKVDNSSVACDDSSVACDGSHRPNPVFPFLFSLLFQEKYTENNFVQLLNFESHITSLKGTQSPEKLIQLENAIIKIVVTAFIITQTLTWLLQKEILSWNHDVALFSVLI